MIGSIIQSKKCFLGIVLCTGLLLSNCVSDDISSPDTTIDTSGDQHETSILNPHDTIATSSSSVLTTILSSSSINSRNNLGSSTGNGSEGIGSSSSGIVYTLPFEKIDLTDKPVITSPSKKGFEGKRGIDGDKKSYWASDESRKNPVFQIDLQALYRVSQVKLFARTDKAYPKHRTNIALLASTDPSFNNSVEFGRIEIGLEEENTLFTLKKGWVQSVELTESFRYLRVQRIHDGGALEFAELVVKGILTERILIANAGSNIQVVDTDSEGLKAVTLDGSASIKGDSPIQAYRWKFGQKIIGTEAVITHTFSVGTNTVELIVVDEDGAKARDSVTVTVKKNPVPVPDGWKLLWNDEFSGDGKVNSNKWAHETMEPGANNNELQKYTTRLENTFQKDGMLHIVGREDWWESNGKKYQYTSGRLKTHGNFDFTYGRVDVRAQLPAGSGSWPAIWMLGSNIFSGAGWPGCGEIDIMEYVGTSPGTIHGTLHAPNYFGGTGQQGTTWADVENNFHVYSVEWFDDRIEFFFDGNRFFTAYPQGGDNHNPAAWPYTKPQFLLLNLAIGGWGGTPDHSKFPMEFLVDYVRVYKKN
ncbi:MAG: family 16 glycosylhydrolase [Fibrobacterales bacterium]